MPISSPVRLVILAALCLGASATFVLAQPVDFGERPIARLQMPLFTDPEITQSIATLDALLAGIPASDDWSASARSPLWKFARHLQSARLTTGQEAMVLKHLDDIARVHPDRATIVGRARQMIASLTVGKVAPPIVGADLQGNPLRLEDYRGKVVVLLFSAEWCAICRTLNPYERLMLELYKNWPFAIVSVETGTSPEAVQQTKERDGLTYRSWWDPGSETGEGAIASAWNAAGFPTVYVIDAKGIIRFVDLRYEDLLKGVRQLLNERPTTNGTNLPKAS
jgi:peroxiredoxin